MTEGIVIFGLLSAVSIVPGVGSNRVPEGVGLGSSKISLDDVASSEVGLEGSGAEGNESEIVGAVVTFKIEAFQVTVVPGKIGQGGTSLDDRLLGCVPVVVGGSEEAARCGSDEGQQNNQNFVHHYDIFINSNIAEKNLMYLSINMPSDLWAVPYIHPFLYRSLYYDNRKVVLRQQTTRFKFKKKKVNCIQ